ncbi:hypothetical protein PRIPAC_88101 [Pristionchus pacificus]|uniref:Uncharacterized protein n=1 Tax=Pristionchus pacificus TaxID=54126 RepID=A0A454Y4J8_PRIPA|nr:hypothetical protein PRIPAC_88101 [Pristionchus pacificus]|eukprot:PDM61578.1 hypothetical protein PRIPAC_51020 [Pristionchus pacificus]
MFTSLLITAAILSASTALKCTHNGTVINDVYQRGVLVYSSTSKYEFGVYECSPSLNRCASFNSIDVAFFRTLDAGKDVSSSLAHNVAFTQGKFTGRSCMSQADVERIFAVKASRCSGWTTSYCYCTTDACA